MFNLLQPGYDAVVQIVRQDRAWVRKQFAARLGPAIVRDYEQALSTLTEALDDTSKQFESAERCVFYMTYVLSEALEVVDELNERAVRLQRQLDEHAIELEDRVEEAQGQRKLVDWFLYGDHQLKYEDLYDLVVQIQDKHALEFKKAALEVEIAREERRAAQASYQAIRLLLFESVGLNSMQHAVSLQFRTKWREELTNNRKLRQKVNQCVAQLQDVEQRLAASQVEIGSLKNLLNQQAVESEWAAWYQQRIYSEVYLHMINWWLEKVRASTRIHASLGLRPQILIEGDTYTMIRSSIRTWRVEAGCWTEYP